MKKYWPLSFFILPGLLIYTIFYAIPTISALGLSFTDWNGLSPDYNFVGLKNYSTMLTQDPIFAKAFGNNLKYMFFVVIFQTIVSLFFAIMLAKNTKLNVFYRALYFLPTVIASVSVAFIWIFVYEPSIGSLNTFLTMLGLKSLIHSWLGDKNIAIYSLAFVQVWAHAGQVMIIFIAGLHSIPKSLYEVARIEGATRWQTFRYVTWPLLAPSATIVVAYTTLQSFKAFDLILATTDGGPSYATEILSLFLYHEAFTNYKFGYASASAVIFLLIIVSITMLQFKILKANKVNY
ncbi:MAG: raffinose/stachyose/melibiose transport system permease protein [Clostridia bacterium]|jgi:raffinose/stachyose/melibiose transport system permease protein|nr:raffinose/stachyose/melibiose transport system permease protein [Clostridia bacterium]MDN5322053.1 raffinose/stachyose/melibiose transport system permease protein [Clostridia bacterium]